MVLDRRRAVSLRLYASDLYYSDVATQAARSTIESSDGGFPRRYFGEVRGETIKTDRINYDSVSYTPELALGR